MKKCRFYNHKWVLVASGLTTSLFDISSKGELWRCEKCNEMKAK